MAEPAPESNDKKKRKSISKFGMMMNSMSRQAKKNLNRAGQQMASGAVKAKQKIAHAPPTEEDPEIISCLERLKSTKTEIYSISDVGRGLYESTGITTTYLYQLSEKLKEVQNTTENDPFSTFSHKMSTYLAYLSGIKYQYLQNMENQLVIPLEQFAENDIDKVQKLKLKYKNGKTQYDVTAHKLNKANQSETKDQSKITAATEKKDAAYKHLEELRNEFKLNVNNLEGKKNGEIFDNVEQYWMGYVNYVQSQNDMIKANMDDMVKSNMDLMDAIPDDIKNDDVKTKGDDSTPPPVEPADNNNNEQYNEQYEDEENDNNPRTVPTDDFNPFDVQLEI